MDEIIRIEPRDEGEAEERVDLFYIGATKYTMLAHPSGSLVIKYMDLTAEKGVDQAMRYVLKAVLGEESYNALMDCDDVTHAQLTKILEIVLKHAMGPVDRPDGPKASGLNGTRKPAGSRKR